MQTEEIGSIMTGYKGWQLMPKEYLIREIKPNAVEDADKLNMVNRHNPNKK